MCLVDYSFVVLMLLDSKSYIVGKPVYLALNGATFEGKLTIMGQVCKQLILLLALVYRVG